MLQRVLLATFSIRPHHATTEALSPPLSHFDPFGTEFREPGRISHPILQRSFQLSPEFLATSRQSGFHCSHADIERRRDLFVCKTFNIPQDHCFSINRRKLLNAFRQSSFSFVRESVLFGISGGWRFQCRNQRQVARRLSQARRCETVASRRLRRHQRQRLRAWLIAIR